MESVFTIRYKFLRSISKASDWIFRNIDGFFRGNYVIRNEKNPGDQDHLCYSYTHVWELNQDVSDIAIKDMQASLNWLLPEFIKRHAERIQQYLLLYFYTDSIIEDESNLDGRPKENQFNLDFFKNAKVLVVFQDFKESFDCKFLSVSDWWLKLYKKLYSLFHKEPKEKTYYLLGSYKYKNCEYSTGNQECMIRGPAGSKLNTALSVQKRI